MPRFLPLFFLVLSAFPAFALSVGPAIELATPVIEPARFRREQPKVASNGTGFLVVWVDGERWNPLQVRATRVDRDGNALDARPLAIGKSGVVTVASDGRDYVVAYDCQAVCLARIDAATGTVTPGGRIAAASVAAIASNGSGYVVAYTRSGTIEGVAVSADGSIAGEPFYVMNSGRQAAIASNGDAYLVVAPQGRELNVNLVSAGKVVAGRLVTDPSRQKSFFGYDVASDGDGFLVTWRESGDLRIARVAANGEASSAQTILTANVTQLAVTWTGAHYLVSYTLDGDVRGIEVSAAGEAGATIDIAAGAGMQGGIAGATNGRETLFAWTNEVRFDAVHVEGSFLGAPPRILSTDATWQESIAAARRGSRTVFAWSEIAGAEQLRRVMVQRLDARDLPLDGRGIPVAASIRHQRRPAVAGSLIAWIEEDPLATYRSEGTVRAKLLDATGVPYGDAFDVGAAQHGSSLAVAAAGNAHLLAWERDGRIVAARIDPYAQTRSAPFSLSSGPGYPVGAVRVPREHSPRVATDGSNFLAIWQRDRWEDISSCVPGCTPPQSLHAAAVTHWGVPVGPPSEVAPRDDNSEPMVVWNGSEYAVFWTKFDGGTMMRSVRRNGIPTGSARVAAANLWLRALRWTGAEYQLVLTGESNALVRLDRELRIVESIAVDEMYWDGPVLTDRYVAYGAGDPRRAVARTIGEETPPLTIVP